jgi:hypothetical protein
MINPSDPFKFGPNWLNVHGFRLSGTGDDVQLGNGQQADENDATLIKTINPKNAVLVGWNARSGAGVFGRCDEAQFDPGGIGVAGQSAHGCGVYGIATEDANTIGVVGRAMSGVEVEDISLEQVVGEPVGVLGHSIKGPGVRGHGGPLLTLPQGPPPPPVQAAPGGVFSSGQLQDTVILGAQDPQEVSLDPLPQLRLIPSKRAVLPTTAEIGDFFLTFLEDPLGAQLWICTDIIGTTPQWQRVQMDSSVGRVPGGSPIP